MKTESMMRGTRILSMTLLLGALGPFVPDLAFGQGASDVQITGNGNVIPNSAPANNRYNTIFTTVGQTETFTITNTNTNVFHFVSITGVRVDTPGNPNLFIAENVSGDLLSGLSVTFDVTYVGPGNGFAYIEVDWTDFTVTPTSSGTQRFQVRGGAGGGGGGGGPGLGPGGTDVDPGPRNNPFDGVATRLKIIQKGDGGKWADTPFRVYIPAKLRRRGRIGGRLLTSQSGVSISDVPVRGRIRQMRARQGLRKFSLRGRWVWNFRKIGGPGNAMGFFRLTVTEVFADGSTTITGPINVGYQSKSKNRESFRLTGRFEGARNVPTP